MPTEYRLGRLKGRFVVSWWEHGKRRRYRLKASRREDADREALDLIRRTIEAPREGVTVNDLWSAYCRDRQGRRVAEAMRHEWKALGPHFGHFRPDQVTAELCRKYAAKRRKAGKHDGTIWTELGHLRTVFLWAHRQRLIDFAPPVERPPKPAPRERFLTRAEAERLVASATQPHIRLAILLMLATAARVGAILELKWSRIDFERGLVDLRASDIGPRKGRAIVPMNDGLRAALLTAKEAALSEYVVEWAGGPVRSVKTGFNAACRAAGLKVTPHDLRRTAARLMVEAGVSIEEVAQYLGHTNPQVTFRVYGRFSPTHLRKAASVLDFATIGEVQ
jgi:integrase